MKIPINNNTIIKKKGSSKGLYELTILINTPNKKDKSEQHV